MLRRMLAGVTAHILTAAESMWSLAADLARRHGGDFLRIPASFDQGAFGHRIPADEAKGHFLLEFHTFGVIVTDMLHVHTRDLLQLTVPIGRVCD